METTKKKRTREEVRAAFRETMRKKKDASSTSVHDYGEKSVAHHIQ
jgi:hypothetical protein